MQAFKYMVLLLSSISLSAQENDTILSNADLTSFVKIKIATVASGTNTDSTLLTVVKDAGIKENRLREIINSRIEEREEKITETEKKSLLLLNDGQRKLLEHKREQLLQLCIKENLSAKKYEFIQAKFDSNLTFQRSLIPIFKIYQSEK